MNFVFVISDLFCILYDLETIFTGMILSILRWLGMNTEMLFFTKKKKILPTTF